MDFKQGQIYELNPEEAQKLCHEGYVFRWIDKVGHNKGEPKIRKYELIGKWEKNKG